MADTEQQASTASANNDSGNGDSNGNKAEGEYTGDPSDG